MATLPDDVSRYLAAVSARVSGVFGDQVVGVYTTGSLALGGYRPGRSDIDVMAVVHDSADLGLRQQLVRQLDHRVLTCPAAGLEFVLYPLATVTRPALAAGYLVNFNTGRSLPPVTSFDPGDEPAFWYAIDRAVRYQSGAALTGPPAQELFAPFPYDELRGAVIASVEAHSDPGEGHLLDNAVLNGCRALCFGSDHRWYTKLEAGERTLPVAGQSASVVRDAIASFQSGRSANTGELTASAVREFLQDVLHRLLMASESRRRP
jgi:hypothetical protein